MNRWMKIAYDEAVKGMLANEGGPFGAVVVKDGRIIAQAHNRVLATKDPTAHAELTAIRDASQKLGRYDLSDCIIYSSSYPCPMCLGAILWARIPTLYFGATGDDAAGGGFDDKRFYSILQGKENMLERIQIDHKSCAELFEQWNGKEDRELY